MKVTHSPNSHHVAALELMYPLCYVSRTELLKLPSLQNVTKFLKEVNSEAAMIVPSMSESFFFDIGQPMDLDVQKYGQAIRDFCSGTTAYELKPLNLLEEIRKQLNATQNKTGSAEDEAEAAVRANLANVVNEMDAKVKAKVQSQKAASKASETTSTSAVPAPVAAGNNGWTMEAASMQAPQSIVERAEELQQLNNELLSSLHSGWNQASFEVKRRELGFVV